MMRFIMHPFSCLSLLTLCAWSEAPISANSSCLYFLPGLHTPASRHNIFIDGSDMPVGIWKFTWQMSDIFSEIFRIIAEEVMGYNVVVSGIGATSESAVFALAGCADGIDCGPSDTSVSSAHVAFDVWAGGAAGLQKYVLYHPRRAPRNLGSVGYVGTEGGFVDSRILDAGLNATGVGVDIYRSYNAKFFDLSPLFSDHSDINQTDLARCQDVVGKAGLVTMYCKHFPDDVGGCEQKPDGSGNRKPKCSPNGYWWYAPACRDRASRCIPYLTDASGWGANAMMQMANQYGMPLAIGFATNWQTFVALAKQHRVINYWYIPETSFDFNTMKKIYFPDYNETQWKAGLYVTENKDSAVEKLVHQGFEDAAQRLFEVVANIELPIASVVRLLNDVDAGKTPRDVACDYLKYSSAWKDWIPDPTDCNPGTGLIDSVGQFVSNRTLAQSCKVCPPGRHTSVYHDNMGTTFECRECLPGRFSDAFRSVHCSACPFGTRQDNIGQSFCSMCEAGKSGNVSCTTCAKDATKVVACVTCERGHFTSSPGALRCDACPLGSYADQEAMSACTVCSVGKFSNLTGRSNCMMCEVEVRGSTSARASQSSTDCVCPKGKYKTMWGDCENCPFGMNCEHGSSIDNFLNLGTSLVQVYPRLQARYWSSSAEPTSVFRCSSAGNCPGGDPGQCATNFVGQACSHCREGWRRSDSQCKECTWIDRSAILFPIIPLALVPFIVLAMYRFFRDPVIQWESWRNGCVAVLFVLLHHYQILSIVSQTEIRVVNSPMLRDWMQAGAWSTDLTALLRTDCVGYAALQPKLIFKLLFPLYLGVVCFLFYCLSHLLQRIGSISHVGMDRDRLLNVFFSVIYTFFMIVVSLSFLLVMCVEHPNHVWTLQADYSINCFEIGGTWSSMLVMAIVACLVYVVGCGTLFTWAIWAARKQFSSEGFRTRWKFLFNKYRPEVLWWSVVFLLKNIVISVGFVAFTAAIWQLYWIMSVVVIYTGLVLLFVPYRQSAANAHEVIVCVCMFYWISMLTWLAEEDEDPDQDDRIVIIMLLAMIMPFFTAGLAISRLAYKGTRSHRRWKSTCTGRLDEVMEAVNILSSLDDCLVRLFFWEHIGEYGQWHLMEMAKIVQAELQGSSKARPTDGLTQQFAQSNSQRNLSIEDMFQSRSAKEFAISNSGSRECEAQRSGKEFAKSSSGSRECEAQRSAKELAKSTRDVACQGEPIDLIYLIDESPKDRSLAKFSL